MIRLPPDFKEFLQLLNAHKVKYLLIGGYAVGYHGYPRATADMDIYGYMGSDGCAKCRATQVAVEYNRDWASFPHILRTKGGATHLAPRWAAHLTRVAY